MSSVLPRLATDPRPQKNIFIGTSGWAYPTWKPDFYPAKTSARQFLSFYSSQLSSVEVNYTFRALPTAQMLADWLAATPEGFSFSFKAPQRITHFSRLADSAAAVTEFLTALEPVRSAAKLGPLLFQLPPNFKADDPNRMKLRAFLRHPDFVGSLLAFEFRHESWFSDEVYDILREHNVALCVADSDDLVTPEVHTAATHCYFRLRRNGGYTSGKLKRHGARLAALSAERTVFAYLKHEEQPTGALNARALLEAARR